MCSDAEASRTGLQQLIHADGNISSLQTRLGQLISIVDLGIFSYAVPPEELKRSLINCQVQCLSKAAAVPLERAFRSIIPGEF
jgi:hypothetical protein